MRITRELLINSARNAAAELLLHEIDLVCIYLTGSLLEEQPLLGGATDIDLICVHAVEPKAPRTLSPIADEFHLDIAHYPQSRYSQRQALRQDAWLGSLMCYSPLILHDTQHWFEFAQSGVFAQFLQPTNTIRRARPFIEQARQFWLSLDQDQSVPDAPEIWQYCRTLELAGNSLACLNGIPLTERRFILNLPERVQALGQPELASSFLNLFMPAEESPFTWEAWLSQWKAAILALNQTNNCPVSLSTIRIPYYEMAIQVLSEENPAAAAWILMRTWTKALANLPRRTPELESWQQFLQVLGLGVENYRNRLEALDGYLELVEDAVNQWALQNGV